MTHTAEAKLAETNLAIRIMRAALLCAPLMLVFAAPPASYAQLVTFSKQLRTRSTGCRTDDPRFRTT